MDNKLANLKRQATADEMAAFERGLKVFAGKWKRDILWQISFGPARFGELRRALPGITERMLASRLRELEADGMVERTVYAEVPARVEYSMTQAAYELAPIFAALVDWANAHTPPEDRA